MKTPGVQFPDNLQSLDLTNNIAHYREIVNNQYMQDDEKDAKKFSFAGGKAKTANFTRLDEAISLESEGLSSEEIRQQTGWFRGYDNKWRFEIDDNRTDVVFAKSSINYSSDETIFDYFGIKKKGDDNEKKSIFVYSHSCNDVFSLPCGAGRGNRFGN